MKRLNQAFKLIRSIEPPAHLEADVLRRIKMARLRQARIKLFISEIGFAGSVLAMFYTIFSLGASLVRSEFWSMISLAFSDIDVVLANWQDFVFSAMETFPVITFILLLLPILVLFISSAVYFSNHKKISGLSGNGRPLAA